MQWYVYKDRLANYIYWAIESFSEKRDKVGASITEY